MPSKRELGGGRSASSPKTRGVGPGQPGRAEVHPPPRTSNKGRQKCPSRDAVSPPVPVPTSPDPQPSPAGVLSGSPSAHGVARPGSGGGGGGG
eukprot:CAMPEP_0206297884 /NCGR_PEP_ID=MMETSP0106_2-20121207/6404_1 /ASSEMBLY_ACC=CAM_ASM_000206 /TAXON_ID=81532 /ORGANISM="Acanthoeca-like sp., Strain 10tr" /LENGTH=92 /DNA_ID=CAMNT_0053728567 /DNA_START=557 /DNA_END=832 /DNA_ORIENTATION=+